MNRKAHNHRSSDVSLARSPWAGADRSQLIRLGLGAFSVLMAYYMLKPAREAVLASASVDLSGVELRGIATVAQGLFAVALAAIYTRLADRLRRSNLIAAVYGSFAVALTLLAGRAQPSGFLPASIEDVLVYVISGAVGLVIIAQFWAFAGDIGGRRAGRMLPILSLTASGGGVAGAFAARCVVESVADPVPTLFVGAAVSLCVAAAAAAAAERNRRGATAAIAAPGYEARDAAAATADRSLTRRYLLGTATVTLFAQWVGTNGENLLFGYVQSALQAQSAAGPAAVMHDTMAFYASFSLWSNVAALLLQVAVAYGCVQGRSGRNLLLVLPVVTLASATAMIFVPAVGLVKCLKVAENATRYSINNTASQLVWLPTSADMKYKAKIIIETVFARLGDALAALTAFIGLRLLQVPLQEMYLFNTVLVIIWAITAAALVREQHRRMHAGATVTRLPLSEDAGASDLRYKLAA